MQVEITLGPPQPRELQLPDGQVIRVLPDSPEYEGESAPIQLPAGFFTHVVELLASDPPWPDCGAITLEYYVPETRTYLPGGTINPETPLPHAIRDPHRLPLAKPLNVTLRARGHASVACKLTVDVRQEDW